MSSTHTAGTSNTPTNPVDAQRAREEEMVLIGNARALKKDARAASRGEQTRVETLTLEHLLPRVSAFLTALVAHHANDSGSRPVWHSVLKDLDPDEVAAMALRGAFGLAVKANTRTRAIRLLGKDLEIVWAHSGLRAKAQTRFQKQRVKALTAARATQGARRKAILQAAQAAELPVWGEDPDMLLRMGEPLLSAVLSVGLFEVFTVHHKGKGTAMFGLSADGRALVQEIEDLGLLARPLMRPMLTPPRPWEDLKTGAYMSDAVRGYLPLVRTSERGQKGLLRRAVKDKSLNPVMEAVNSLQGVGYRINAPVLALREWAWETGLDIPDVFPLRTPVAVPEVPDDIASWAKPDRQRFWSGRAHARRVNDGIAPNLIAFNATSREALDLLGVKSFFLPHSMDFRGRIYPVPFLNHHQGDATKALFVFAKGEMLGEFGLSWLKVHAANSGDFGKISKKSFEDRVAWVDANMELILATARTPREDLRWVQADAPFSFYAACLDIAGALANPEGPNCYVSRLPVALDGSNSGVQHFSALMRAEEGKFVNLTPEEAPQDLYTQVADAVAHVASRARMRGLHRALAMGRTYPTREELLGFLEALNGNIEEMEAPFREVELRPDTRSVSIIRKLKTRRRLLCALIWAEEGVVRSTVKRSVMTYGYSSVAYGMGQQIREDLMEPLALRVLKGELSRHPFGTDDGKAAAGWMGREVYRAVVRVLPGVSEAMKWLQATASVLAHEGKGVLLVTPTGFPMLMKESEWNIKQVELHLLDRSISVLQAGPNDRIVGDSVLARTTSTVRTGATQTVLKAKQQSGIAPNVVHALDACHLQMVVLRMGDLNHRLMVIHDSFATHAGAVGTLSVVLREQMVALYDTYCPLADIHARAVSVLSPEGVLKLPPVPRKGSLDLSGIGEAIYSFS